MKRAIRQRVISAFQERFGTEPDFLIRAPGRVNLLGEHVDYNQGFVLPAAIDLVTLIAVRRSGSSFSTIRALDLNDESTFDPRSILEKQDTYGKAFSSWVCYPAGMMWSLINEKMDTPGMQAVFSSDIPRGAGLSSSASVEMAFGLAWQELGNWRIPSVQMAKIGLRAEIEYVGLNCGIMDQFASACGVKDRLLYLDCRSLDWQTFPLPQSSDIVIADTSIRRSLTGSVYNERKKSCEEAVRILKGLLPGIESFRDVSVSQFQEFSDHLDGVTAKRTQHVIEEIARTIQAKGYLQNNDAEGFGKLMNACHSSLRDLFEVSCPELDAMSALAQKLPGCYGARLTGAGFGGCTVNLVDRQAVEGFSRNLSIGYTQITGLIPEIQICRAVDGAGLNEVKSPHD